MTTGYERDNHRTLQRIANALESIAEDMAYIRTQVEAEREGATGPLEDNDGTGIGDD